MEGGGALFNSGFLGANFLWWVGQIADDSTWRDNILPGKHESANSIPGWGRRYKVRIIGLHDKEETTVASDQLPWAQVMYPVTAGGGQANSAVTSALRQGNFVFGFFLDGQDMQVPVIMGVLGNNAQTALKTSIGNDDSNFAATSGFAEGAEPKTGSAKEKVPDEGLKTEKPKGNPAPPGQTSQDECAPPPPGVRLNKYGLRPDLPLTSQQLADAQSARVEADQNGLTGQERENFVQQRVADGIKNRCAQKNSKDSRSQPGATKENADAVHETSISDVKREDKMQEKISLLKPDDTVGSAIKGIQIEIENLTSKIEKYLKAINHYVDAASNTIDSLQKVIQNASQIIAKYMKIVFDKVMEFVLKTLNKALTKAVSALPSSMRAMFSDIKEVLTELILCLYGKITNGLVDLIGSLLNDALKPEELEAQARAVEFDPDSPITVPKVPVCSSEDLVGRALAQHKDEINNANNNLINNVGSFLSDMQNEVSGVSDSLSDLNITGALDSIVGGMAAALSFQNLSLNVFGCELKPNVAVSDYYTFGGGGATGESKQLPSTKGVADVAEQKEPTAAPAQDIPFSAPNGSTQDVDLDAGAPDEDVSGALEIL
jgi:hypothetical protein